MQVINDLHWAPVFAEGTATTIGEFDGVHRGHSVVLHELSRQAALIGCPTVVVTFDRDPITISAPESAPACLTGLDHKLELLASTGVDYAVVVPAEFVAQQPDASTDSADDRAVLDRLISTVLIGALRIRTVVVGEDFCFGARRRATIQLLMERSAQECFEVAHVPVSARLTKSGDVISSTSIRESLRSGDVRSAALMLGRPYEIRSVVATGDRRGRSLGFPTANLPVHAGMQLPCDGVYAGWFRRASGSDLPAAINIGRRPTFYENAETSLVEAHLVGFRGDLYGEAVRLRFVERLRGELRFDGIDELRSQLEVDVRDTVTALQ